MRRFALILSFAFVCSPATADVEQGVAFPNLAFDFPVDLQNAGDGTNRLFVVEKAGKIWVFENHRTVTAVTLFLDIESQVDSDHREEGLLGLTFHPAYPESGYFYVNYTTESPDQSIISRFRVSATDPDSADASSEVVLLAIDQPLDRHNAGQLAFGPDGFLYIAMGEGGVDANAQDLMTLLGSIMRIDVDSTQDSLNYAIPADNPFVGNTSGYREEIYAYGLRNPWRFSIDPVTGWLWLGDVGHDAWEEVNIVESGKNYGWPIMEGAECYRGGPCDTTGLTLPVWAYAHPGPGPARAITGGHVYRYPSVPDLYGKYVCADYQGEIYAIDYDGISPPIDTLLFDLSAELSTFGVDENNELYFCNSLSGKIYKFFPAVVSAIEPPASPSAFSLAQNHPNPFNPVTSIRFEVPHRSFVTLRVHDVTGRRVQTILRGWRGAGEHTARWDGTDSSGNMVSSGIYFCSLESGDRRVTRKMVFLK